MRSAKQVFGQSGEEMAVRHLRKLGYKIIERNFRTVSGEIDIIARHKGTIVFVEVKSRRSLTFGDPKEAITPVKKRHLSMAALAYLKKNGSLQTRSRFDVVAIVTDDQPRIEVITNAFELAY
jgi:putative endonuclease